MTAKQEKVLESIKAMIPRFDFYGENYEVKEWSIEDGGFGDIYLYFETGMQGDEDTLAQVLCRKRRHCRIGKRGGIVSIQTGAPHRGEYVSAFVFMNECAAR